MEALTGGEPGLRVLWLYHRRFAYHDGRADFERPEAGSRLVLRPVVSPPAERPPRRAAPRGAMRWRQLRLGAAFAVRVEQLRLTPHSPVGLVVVRPLPSYPAASSSAAAAAAAGTYE